MPNDINEMKKFVNNVKKLVEKKVNNAKTDTSKKAIVQSLNEDGTVNIIINGEVYNNVKVRPGFQPQINEVVLVCLPNNNSKDMYVDLASVTTFQGSLHTHSNLSILETITQALIDAWNSAVSHISDAIRHITSDERNLWNTVVNKVDKIEGKGLSTEDYTTEEKNKLAGISADANKTEGSNINGNIKIDGIETTVYTHPSTHPASIIVEDSTHRFVTDAEKDTWNNKQDSLGYTPENIANKGVANGYASLDSNGKIPLSQIPDATFNTYTHYQITPSDNWVIKHNLNRYPSVTIVDSSGNVVVGEVKYIDNNTINISLVGVFAGTAYLN